MYFRIQLKEKQQLKAGKKTITVYSAQLPKNHHQKFLQISSSRQLEMQLFLNTN